MPGVVGAPADDYATVAVDGVAVLVADADVRAVSDGVVPLVRCRCRHDGCGVIRTPGAVSGASALYDDVGARCSQSGAVSARHLAVGASLGWLPGGRGGASRRRIAAEGT